MSRETLASRWTTDGKFFRSAGKRVAMKAVTFGPFPDGMLRMAERDFPEIAAAGFNAVRLYQMPDTGLLDLAARSGLAVFGGLEWSQSADFIQKPGLYSAARVALAEGLRLCGEHPALSGIYVGNEVPADLVRWMGAEKVREAIEELIALGKEIRPDLLFAYANYPSTEYLEPGNADFTAMNVFLESEAAFRSYLARLQHIAGDRPLVISEFGLDSRRNGLEAQAETLAWGARAARDEGAAGFTVYAWSDLWFASTVVTDWDFGLTDREGGAKPALSTVSGALREPLPSPAGPEFSVIVCTRNGRDRIAGCLEALARQTWENFEVIVVDDGSTDGTANFVKARFPLVKLLRLEPCGLSAARNAGAEIAGGEIITFTDDDCEPDEDWLKELARCFADGWDAAGGPNLPPPPQDEISAVVASAPGAPSHVMLDDREAEHLPGCNIAVRRGAFFAINGFDPRFRTAGDDVDFCWRLRDRGFRLGFSPTAFVWHHRRNSFRGYLRQQLGYGKAEAILISVHPARFTKHGDARWEGFVYEGGPLRAQENAIIYHGPMGMAGYQNVVSRMQPLRALAAPFDSLRARALLILARWLQPRVRAWARNRRWWLPSLTKHRSALPTPDNEFHIDSPEGHDRVHYLGLLLADGWKPGGECDEWDVSKNGTRLLLATERGHGIAKRTLIRQWGPAPELPAGMRP